MILEHIKVIGFDLDQTLYPKSPEIDTAIQGYIYEKIADHKKIPIEEAEKLFCDLYQNGNGLSGRKTLLTLGIPRSEEIVQEALENADIDKFLSPNPDVLNFLQRLKEKYSYIDLITGSNKKVTEKKLNKLHISEKYFNNIITASDASKSDKSAFIKWLSYYPKFQPKNFLYIGDRSSTDYTIPKEMKMESILVHVKDTNPLFHCIQLSNFLELEKILLN